MMKRMLEQSSAVAEWQNRLARQSMKRLLGKNSPTPIIFSKSCSIARCLAAMA